MMRRTVAVVLAATLATLGAAGLSGCGTDRSTDEDSTTLRIGVMRIASQAPFFIGLERGYFEEEGLDVEFVFFDAAVPSTIAVVSRDVDVSVIGFTPAFFNLAIHGGITIIGGHSREAPGFRNTGIFVSDAAWQDGVRTIPDMAGRSIGLTTLGSTNHYAVARVAERHGVDLSTARLVPAQGMGNLAAMLTSGHVDIAAAAGTALNPVVEAGHAHVLAWAGDEVSWQLGGIAAHPRLIRDNPEALRALMRVYDRGAAEYWEWLLERNPDGSFRDRERAEELLGIVNAYTSVPVSVLADSLAYIDARLDVGSIFELADWYREQRMIDPDTDPADFLDLSFVDGHENVPPQMRTE